MKKNRKKGRARKVNFAEDVCYVALMCAETHVQKFVYYSLPPRPKKEMMPEGREFEENLEQGRGECSMQGGYTHTHTHTHTHSLTHTHTSI
jgi:hypothetical protein